MLSGIGPAEHLKEKGITVVHDLPGVGQHLLDHPTVDVWLKDKTGDGSLAYLRPQKAKHIPKALNALAKYLLHGTGPYANNVRFFVFSLQFCLRLAFSKVGESAAFIRTDDRNLFPRDQYPEDIEDSTSGDNGPDLELFCSPFAYKDHGAYLFDMPTYSIHCYLTRYAIF